MIRENTISNESAGAYVLITAAHNEEVYIERTLLSVINQSVRPMKWVIVNDRSTDRTEEIIQQYQASYGFIMHLTITGDSTRNFGAQVRAINSGYELIKHLDFDFIGNLDADISFKAHYFEQLLNSFDQNKNLGLIGGTIYEQYGGEFQPRKFNNPRSVPHAVQLFRRRCFEDIGGYIPLRYGGPDWYAEVSARMQGWEVHAMQELEVYHHRPTMGAEGSIRGAFRQGRMDYSLGSHPLFEIAKCASRVRAKPYVLVGLSRLIAFLWATFKREKREVSDEFLKYLRQEQSMRLKGTIEIRRNHP
jgi:GT2 family glycosyltransferase